MSAYVCDHEGCDRGPGTTGDALFRVSPKGGPFVGLCGPHQRLELEEAMGTLEVIANADS